MAQPKDKKDAVTPSKGTPKNKMPKALRHMMYGFGDVSEPLDESVELLENIVTEYVQEMTAKALKVTVKEDNKITLDDLLFVLRKDRKKYARAIELVHAHKEISQYRKVFDWDKV